MKLKSIKVWVVGMIALAIASLLSGIVINIKANDRQFEAEVHYSSEEKPVEIDGDMGELETEEIPTVEEVDGGRFEDAATGLSVVEGEYSDLGWAETYDTSSPEAFAKATLGRCIYANNKFGAQCVSLARVYWWSYANRDVSTCGTGMAKGMMNCTKENAGDEFDVYYGKTGIQAGDWIVFTGGLYGHVGMALGTVKDGYVALLGENQGGRPCEGGGAATNIINISVKNLIGYYRPKAYIAPEPKPEPKPTPTPKPAPTPVNKCQERKVVAGDTLGAIMKECRGEVEWGAAMDEYAQKWLDKDTGKTVYYGWTHGTGYGLIAGHTIVLQ